MDLTLSFLVTSFVASFFIGLGVGLGLSVASFVLPITRNISYDNQDKTNRRWN